MTDIVDNATEEITTGQEQRLKALRRKVVHIKQQSSQFCKECGDPIPVERQQAVSGCCLCVECQKEREEKQNA